MSPSVRLYADFDDPALSPETWADVAAIGDTWTVFQEWHWQRTWWQSFGRGELLIAAATNAAGRTIALAPLFVDGGMAFLVGSGGSDYLDLIGDVDAPGVLEAIVASITEHVPDLLGFRFYHVPETSRTGVRLVEAALYLGLTCYDEGELAAPVLDLGPSGAAGTAAAEKKSLVRHERRFCREGTLVVRHCRTAQDILPCLDAFFAQHEDRWRDTSSPSLFHDAAQRAFYRRLAVDADTSGWLRFTVVEWNDRPIAFHFGFSHRGTYLWYKPAFAIELARLSPGEVLLRQLLLAAVEEGAHTFDLGLGDETFKRRFATRVPLVRTWGVYPRI